MTHPTIGHPTLDMLRRAQIVPVIDLDDVDDVVPLAEALLAGGITTMEITLRTDAAIPGIERITRHVDAGDMLVGSGTVLSSDDVDRSVDAGARYLVCPGYSAEVVERARHHDIAVLPGVATGTELQTAVVAGVTAVKLFPAGVIGGVAAIKAFAGPFPQMWVMPSGGVDIANARNYLAQPTVFAVGGSWIAPRRAIRARDFAGITATARTTTERLAEPNDG